MLPIWLHAGVEVGKVEAVDASTFTVKFLEFLKALMSQTPTNFCPPLAS